MPLIIESCPFCGSSRVQVLTRPMEKTQAEAQGVPFEELEKKYMERSRNIINEVYLAYSMENSGNLKEALEKRMHAAVEITLLPKKAIAAWSDSTQKYSVMCNSCNAIGPFYAKLIDAVIWWNIGAKSPQLRQEERERVRREMMNKILKEMERKAKKEEPEEYGDDRDGEEEEEEEEEELA